MRMNAPGLTMPLTMLLLAGCGGGSQTNGAAAANEVNRAAPENGVIARVRDMPDGERNAMLIRAIRDANLNCQHVASSTLSETTQNVPVYFATCDDGAVYAVAVADDGNLSVRPVTPAGQPGGGESK